MRAERSILGGCLIGVAACGSAPVEVLSGRPPETEWHVEGRLVHYSSGQAVRGAEVELCLGPCTAKPLAVAVTNAEGVFRFLHVPSGDYWVASVSSKASFRACRVVETLPVAHSLSMPRDCDARSHACDLGQFEVCIPFDTTP
ncbi:MAG: carboxypeptidase-like regulatory domain-containing protein [Polyangiaceae bacterium]